MLYRAISTSAFVCYNLIRLHIRRIFIAEDRSLKHVFRIPVHISSKSNPERRRHLICVQYEVKSLTGSH
jgi:hypothetical protein